MLRSVSWGKNSTAERNIQKNSTLYNSNLEEECQL